MVPPDWVSRIADVTTNIIRPRSKERGHGVMLERATGLEPADTSLGSWGLTTLQLAIYDFRVHLVHEILNFRVQLVHEIEKWSKLKQA